MTRVVYLVHSAAPSGAELALSRTLRNWHRDARLTVVFGSHGPLIDVYREVGVTVRVLPMPESIAGTRRSARVTAKARAMLGLAGYVRAVRRELKHARPDVVVAISLKSVVYGRLASLGLRTKFVWSIHDRLSPDYLGRIGSLYSKVLPRFVDGIMVNSRSTLETVAHRTTPCLVVPPGLARRRVLRDHPESLAEFAILGRISPWKGQDRGIRAFAQAELPDSARLHIIGAPLFGETAYEASLHDLVTELGLSDRVVFHGHVDRPSDLLDQMDVLLHTSVLPEPFGAVVVEGMDSDCVVVATSPGGPSEVIEHGQNGFLTPAGDVAAMSSVLTLIASLDASELARIRDAAHATAAKYDVAVTAAAVSGFVRACGEGSARPGVVTWDLWSDGLVLPCE